ncbi:MAG: DUF3352 domain-containing protein [Nocardioidaceae bacterium]
MDGTTPPQGDPGASAQPWGYGPAGPQPPYDGQPNTTRGLRALVLSVVLTLLVGGGAFAFYQVDPFHLFRAGPQASEALPANAVFYAGLDLDPTASQKISALRFLNHFPAFRENAGLTDANADVREALVGQAIDGLHCPGVDYAHDVRPWLGERFGVAVMPAGAQGPTPVAVAVQVSDDDAARTGVEALNACDDAVSGGLPGESSALGISFVNGYLLLAETQSQADAYARSADAHPLADDPDFMADLDSLGDLGVVTLWADIVGLVDAYGSGLTDAGQLDVLTSTVGRVAATVRFASDHVEVASSIYGDTPAVDHDDNPIVSLPDTTVFAMSESGGDQRVATAWKKSIARARSGNPAIDRQISQFAARSGLSLPADLETLLGHNVLLALDKQGLSAQALSADDLSVLNFGARFTNDPAKLGALYDKLVDLIRTETGSDIPFVRRDLEDGIAVATNDAYAARLGSLDGNLGDSDDFTSVVDDGAGKEFVMFLNFDAIKDQVMQAMEDGGVEQAVLENLRPLKAFGITAEVDGHYQHVTMRLSVDD